MPHEAKGATACVLNGRLYVIGGEGSNKLQVLEMTEENGLSWSRKADLPANRYNAASVVHEDRIWVMGGDVGNQPSASVITYDAEADAWETGPPLPLPCDGCRATQVDGSIFLHHRDGLHQFREAAWSAVAGDWTGRYPVWGSVLLG